MSTVSKDDNLVLTSVESSSYPDDSGLELGLGLSLGGGRDGGGGGGNSRSALNSEPGQWSQYARILTAKDFPSLGSSLSSSSSSSSYLTKANFSGADPVSPQANNGASQVVGWPPVRAYRMNSLANQAKYPTSEEFQSPTAKTKSKNGVIDLNDSEKEGCIVKEKGQMKSSLYVKVNMDGNLIGRKVDLSAHSCYETLAQTMEDMFCRPATSISTRRLEGKEHDVRMEATGSLKLLDGSSEFVLTYEDKDGDWMLVGDVPWGMFFNSVKRLRIMRTSEANGLGPRFQQRDGRQIGHV